MGKTGEIVIRPARIGHARQISDILRDVGWFGLIEEESPKDTEERISKLLGLCNNNSHEVLVAENRDGKLSGYIVIHWLPCLFLSAPEAYISDLFVINSERCKGIGRKLVEEAIELSRKRGCSRLMLLNGRHRESYQRHFYEKLGWKERSDIANFIYSL